MHPVGLLTPHVIEHVDGLSSVRNRDAQLLFLVHRNRARQFEQLVDWQFVFGESIDRREHLGNHGVVDVDRCGEDLRLTRGTGYEKQRDQDGKYAQHKDLRYGTGTT